MSSCSSPVAVEDQNGEGAVSLVDDKEVELDIKEEEVEEEGLGLVGLDDEEGFELPEDDGDLESLEGGSAFANSHVCRLCDERLDNPRVLPCLHSFCHECLVKEANQSASGSSAQERLTRALVPGVITCKICHQEAALGPKGVEELPFDYVLMNVLDMEAIAELQIVCTSCKAREKAVARCSDCANFLCPNCVTAHQYMRCFENHKVVSFEELRSIEGIPIHKPIFCNLHSTENLKYFCNTCQVPICNECMMAEHRQPDHRHERIPELGDKLLDDLKSLVSESRRKVTACNEASFNLENLLSDLQMQRDQARGLIEETFQSYRTTLQQRKEDLMEELEGVHKRQELSLMELFHNVEKTTEKIEDGCEFTERVLKHGNAVEILLVKRQIQDQLMGLNNSTPKLDIKIKVEFSTDAEKFESAVKSTFGHLQSSGVGASSAKDSVVEPADLASPEQPLQPDTPLVPPFNAEGALSIPQSLLDADPSLLTPVSVGDLIPALASLNMNTGMDTIGDIAGVSAQTMNTIASSLQQLPNMAMNAEPARSSSRNSYSPAMSDSGISVDAASNSSGAQGQVITAAELAKLGQISVNSQGNVKLNDHLLPGLNINNVTGLAQQMQLQQQNSRLRGNNTPDQDLAAILGTMPPQSSSSSRSQTPQHLNEIAGLLSQTSPTSMLSGLTSPGLPVLGSSGSSNPLSSSNPLLSSMGATALNPGTPISSQMPSTRTKMSAMQIRCKFGQLGPGKGQFNSPHGFCLGMEEDIVVADTNNHRIQVFEKSGEFKYQFGIPGKEEGQLWYPRKVAVIRHSGKYVVCDRGNERSRMQIFTKNGHFIKKIAIRYIDIVAGLAITEQGHIVAVDSVSPTVFCIAESGDLIKWFDCSDYMREPSDIAISGKEYFVCDFKGHCVVVFNEEGNFMRRIGCENITNFPNGIDISDAGDVLIGDSHGNRFHVAVFQSDGSLTGEFECPYVKVSRCCGLNVTSEGHVVTLAKNNHHVLVLNTLYIA